MTCPWIPTAANSHVVIGLPRVALVLRVRGHVFCMALIQVDDLVHPGRGQHPLAGKLAMIAHHHAEARGIPGSAVHAAGGHWHIGPVDRDVRVVLGADLCPDMLLQKILQTEATQAGDEPTQHVGITGVVVKRVAWFE